MGPIFVFFGWAAIGGIVGLIVFLILAGAVLVLPLKNKQPILRTVAMLATFIAVGTAAAMPSMFFLSPLLPDNPANDFRLVFDRPPPKAVQILDSRSSAGTDFLEATIKLKVSTEDLEELVTAWQPGAVDESALPPDDGLDRKEPCSGSRAFLDTRDAPNHTTAYRAVLYCLDDLIALAVRSQLD